VVRPKVPVWTEWVFDRVEAEPLPDLSRLEIDGFVTWKDGRVRRGLSIIPEPVLKSMRHERLLRRERQMRAKL
jgi:hypothetical protein